MIIALPTSPVTLRPTNHLTKNSNQTETYQAPLRGHTHPFAQHLRVGKADAVRFPANAAAAAGVECVLFGADRSMGFSGFPPRKSVVRNTSATANITTLPVLI